jgi:hypothetical protein
MVAYSKHEDIVRRRDTDWNILTAGFKRYLPTDANPSRPSGLPSIGQI